MDDQFRLDGFATNSPQSQELADNLPMSADMHHALAAHHSQSLAYDRAAIWSTGPGAPAYLTVHVHRGPDRTYDIDAMRHPLSTNPCCRRAGAARSRSAAALGRTAAASPTTPAEPAAAATPSPHPRSNTRNAP